MEVSEYVPVKNEKEGELWQGMTRNEKSKSFFQKIDKKRLKIDSTCTISFDKFNRFKL